MRIPSLIPFSLCLASSFIFGDAPMVAADEPKPVVSQTPGEAAGGCLAIAQPMKVTGGWKGVYRAADDFILTESTEVGEVVWWGHSSDGRHGENDGLDQVLGFAIGIYEHNPNTKQTGRCLHRTIVPLQETAPQRTRFQSFSGSDVMRFKAPLVAPFEAEAESRYWFSVTAYLSGEPMWVWIKGTNGNAKNAIDYGVNGIWGDGPARWEPLDLAFELRAESVREKGPKTDFEKSGGEQGSEAAVIRRLVKQLGSDEYIEREAAEIRLTAIGKAAAPFMTPHAKHDDPEIRYRVRCLLTKCGNLEKTLPMKTHTVQEGERIIDLAKLYAVSSDAIVKANALGEQSLRAGMMVRIPE